MLTEYPENKKKNALKKTLYNERQNYQAFITKGKIEIKMEIF